MHADLATEDQQQQWDTFLGGQQFRPFLQSWTMGDVFADCGQTPLRLLVREGNEVRGICQAIVVPAKRGRHLAIHYGPLITGPDCLPPLITALADLAAAHKCAFIRMSPFLPVAHEDQWQTSITNAGKKTLPSPMHMLGEHLWYLPLQKEDPWSNGEPATRHPQLETDILMSMRKTTRNLVRRAERDGVTVTASDDPVRDLPFFLALHEETRKRHGFTPYTDNFFRAQVTRFAPRKECTLYLARYNGEVLSSSIHMHAFGETSYHHGASTQKLREVPTSYLLQWRAIQDALARGDHVYNFWGIAPMQASEGPGTKVQVPSNHPFAGVTLFKTGFGGSLLELMHCVDIPLTRRYYGTRIFEMARKWKRGF